MNKKLVYADHAATTPLCDAAWAAMKPFLREEFGNPSSLHSFAKKPREAVSAARATIAACINADPEEIYFTSGGTESDNWVIKGCGHNLAVSAYEHHAVLNAAESIAKLGRSVSVVRPNSDGLVTTRQLSKSCVGEIGLVSVMTANNEIGVINPIRELAAEAHGCDALFHTDAVQAMGHVPIDVREMDVDFLSASAHKFNGPKGIGFLFARRGLRFSSLMNGGQQESGARAGTENVASIVGMAAALQWNCERMEENASHQNDLVRRFREGIAKCFPSAIYLGSEKCCSLPGFISVAFPGHSAEGLLHMLDLKGIAVSTGAACDSKNTQISHVLKAIRLPRKIATSTLRITFGWENTYADVDAVVNALGFLLTRR